MIVWEPNKAIDIGEWSICGGAQLERFIYIYMYFISQNYAVIKIRNAASREGFEPTLFIVHASVLAITLPRLPNVITLTLTGWRISSVD